MKVVISVALLFLSSAYGQSIKPTRELVLPPGEPAKVDTSLQDALAEIALLKRIVAEQDRRITALERIVAPNRSAAMVSQLPAAPSPEWKTPAAWKRLKNGMSSAQVIAILGKPTSMESVGPYRTLFYQGDVPGSGSVTGTIKLGDDRVWEINIPVF
jgi:hypothetical protein